MASRRRTHVLGRVSFVLGVTGIVVSMASMALAVVPLTTVSTDPYTNTSSFHQTQVEPDTYSFSSTIVSVFQSSPSRKT